MARPRSIKRVNGKFPTTCPRCSRTRFLKSNPCGRRDCVCTSCLRSGKPSKAAFTLPTDAIERYRAGTSALTLAREWGVDAWTVIRALQRAGAETRDMSGAIKLIGTISAVQEHAAALRATGELQQRMSAGRLGIPLSEWTEFSKDRWGRERASKQWKDWRAAVFAHDGFRCVLCRATKTREAPLDPHHIWPKARHPERLYDVTNGVTLCRPCHMGITGHEGDIAPLLEAYVASIGRSLAVG